MRVVVNYAQPSGAGRIRMSFFTGANWIGGLVPEVFPRVPPHGGSPPPVADLETRFEGFTERPHIWGEVDHELRHVLGHGDHGAHH